MISRLNLNSSMRHIACAFVATSMVFVGSTLSLQAKKPVTKTLSLEIGSYNTRHCSGMDNKVMTKRTAGVLRKMNVPYIAVQEMDSCTMRCGDFNQMEILGRELGMVPTYSRTIPLQGGAYGVGLLSKAVPISIKRYSLPGTEEVRTLVCCEFNDFVFASTHITLTQNDRMASLPILIKAAQEYNKPFVIAGDWNDKPSSEFIKLLKQSFTIVSRTDVNTFPADKPNQCIDYIAVYTGLEGQLNPDKKAFKKKFGKQSRLQKITVDSSNASVIAEPAASDHRPIQASFTLNLEYDK